jgi:hypothetical protein
MDGYTDFLFADDGSIKLVAVALRGFDMTWPDQSGISSLGLLLKVFNFLGRSAHNVRIVELSGSIVRTELLRLQPNMVDPADRLAIVTVDQDRDAITGFELIA